MGFGAMPQKYGPDFAAITAVKRDKVCREEFNEPLRRAKMIAREQAND